MKLAEGFPPIAVIPNGLISSFTSLFWLATGSTSISGYGLTFKKSQLPSSSNPAVPEVPIKPTAKSTDGSCNAVSIFPWAVIVPSNVREPPFI